MKKFNRVIALMLCLGTLLSTLRAQAQVTTKSIREASGIARAGDNLILVGDGDNGIYYTYDISGLPFERTLILNDPRRIHPETWTVATPRGESLLQDVEGVTILPNGEVLLLSENSRALIGRSGVLIEYPSQYAENGNRGLEGVALFYKEGQGTEVAAIWEGGYFVREDTHPGTATIDVNRSYAPVIVRHTIALDGSPVTKGDIVLDMQVPNRWIDEHHGRGSEPDAFRFRAPDLVWHKEGFIVLLSSERSPQQRYLPRSEKYGPKILQRFDLNGKALGDPFDLDHALKAVNAPAAKNWEGMGWFEPGEKLMFVFDQEEHPPTVAIIDLPENWR